MDDGIITRNWSIYAKYLGGIYLIFTFFLIVIGNVFVVIVQLRVKDNYIPISTKHFIINLAVADLGVGTFVIPFSVATLFDADCCTSSHFQRLSGLANYCFCIASIVTLTSLSIDRYIAMAFPLKSENILTPKRAKIMCALVWMYSILVAIPVVSTSFRYQCIIPNIGSCTTRDWTGSPVVLAVTTSVILLTFGLSLGCMLFSYFHIFLIARRHARKIQIEVTAAEATKIELSLEKTNRFFQQDTRVVVTCECEIEPDKKPESPARLHFTHIEPPATVTKTPKPSSEAINSSGSIQVPRSTSLAKSEFRLVNKGEDELRIKLKCSRKVRNSSKQNRKSSTIHDCDDEKRKQASSGRQFKTSINLATNLLLIICVFFLCWSPWCLTLLIEIGMELKVTADINLIFVWIAYSNSFCNPIIYCFRYRSFRIVLGKTLGCIRSKLRRKETQTRIKPFQEEQELP